MKNLYIIKQSQRDSRWGSILLGYNTDPEYTLANYGCLITCLASYVGITPASANEKLKQNGGFVSGGLFVWGKSTVLGLNQTYLSPRYEDAVTTQGLNKIRESIDAGYPVLTEVDFYPSTINLDMHYVMITGYAENDVFYALDPWTGSIIDLSVYGGARRAIYQFRTYDKKLEFISNSSEPMNEYKEKLNKWFNFETSPDQVITFLNERKREIETKDQRIGELQVVVSTQSEQLLSVRAERNKALEKLELAVEKAEKCELLKKEYYDQKQTWKKNFEDEKLRSASLQKQLTELKNKQDLTVGELVVRLWNKVRGVKI